MAENRRTALFLIGIRVNRWWQVWRWLPVAVAVVIAIAMPRMLNELQRTRNLGLVGKPRPLVSGRVVLVWQYWESFEKRTAYASAQDQLRLRAWRRFNRTVRDNGSVGIFHETVVVSDDSVATVYGNMPTVGLACVTGAVPASRRGRRPQLA